MPIQPVLVDGPETLVAVTQVTAYSTGVTFELDLRGRGAGAHSFDHDLEGWQYGPRYGEGPPPGRWRFGVAFADGRRASDGAYAEPGASPPELVLEERGGGGGGGRTHRHYWLWPLPPAGDVRFVCRWPDRGVDERTVVVAAEVLHEAATRSRPLWPDEPARAPLGSGTAGAWPPGEGASEVAFMVGGSGDIPEWLWPPQETLGVPASLEVPLAHTDEVAAAIRNVVVHPTGIEFTLALRQRDRRFRVATGAGEPMLSAVPPGEHPTEIARLGVEFADGRRATNLARAPDLGAAGATLQESSGTGVAGGWDGRFWLGPLPPDGPLAIDFEWPVAGAPARRVEVDAAALRRLVR